MFGRKGRTPLERLQRAIGTCRSCGRQHEGMFDLVAAAPDHWEGSTTHHPNAALMLDGDFLSEDFCVLGGEHFFIRCVFEIPVEGLPDKFGFGCWSTLSRKNFEKYLASFDDGRPVDLGPWTGWFGNALKPYPSSINEPCWVYPQLGRQRPTIALDSLNHPLSQAQEQGITVDQLLAIYRANGHDLDAGAA